MFKKFVLSIFTVAAIASVSNVFGQSNAPAVADNADPRDTNIKMRSVDLERTERDSLTAKRAAKFAPINKELNKNFPQIKEDFEGIQNAQTAIVNAYTGGKTIDYAAITSSATAVNEKAKRLDTNLFAASADAKLEDDKPKTETETKPKTVRDLIIELDNTVNSFVSSSIFVPKKVVSAEEAIKTRTDLLKIQELSAQLAEEAKKMK